MGRVHEGDEVSMSYEIFNVEFEKKFVLNVARDRKAAEFSRLVRLAVAEYEAKFSELSRCSPHVVTALREKFCKFQEGLIPFIQNRLAPLMIEGYADAYERALLIKDTANRLAEDRQF